MAQRDASRAKKRATPASRQSPAAKPMARAEPPGSKPSTKLAALEAERDRLTTELKEAHRRIAALEQAREQALNRIDWVIDSLHNLTEE